MGLCIKDIKAKIEDIAKTVFTQDKDIADNILVTRQTKTPIVCVYTFGIKVKHDDELGQKLYEAFMDEYTRYKLLECVKTEVVAENGKLKEIFFLKIEINATKGF